MILLGRIKNGLPSPVNALLMLLSAALLILAFPDFEIYFLAWIAFVPFFYAIEREKESKAKTFLLGWLWGTTFFFGTCWWLGFAPTHYGGIPAFVSYLLILCVCFIVGVFPALFACLLSIILKRFGLRAILAAPFLWTAIEFLRFWTTGNDWNAVAYSQAFFRGASRYAQIGGIWLVGFLVIAFSALIVFAVKNHSVKDRISVGVGLLLIFTAVFEIVRPSAFQGQPTAKVIAVQPNVPMDGLTEPQREKLLDAHIAAAESVLKAPGGGDNLPRTVIFPESPMNFMFESDREFQSIIKNFARRNQTSVLFNSAEPNRADGNFFNSAVMIDERGAKTAQYDKIFLVPFGEYAPVPAPLQAFVPTMVGSFAAGNEYDLLNFGAAKAGVMICFESHFPNLSREYALRNADVLIELTNDGYLGNTPVLRQHLANAVFRAVETNRPIVRVTNVGITAYIDENGTIRDAANVYTEAARVWTISKSDGAQTFYVKYGDWFAWICAVVSLFLLGMTFKKRD